jgi:hypothetical protein
MTNSKKRTYASRKGLNGRLSFTASVLLLSGAAFQASAQVTMSNSGATAPDAGSDGISQLDASGTLVSYIDYSNNHTLQSFSLGNAPYYYLNSISLKANSDFGGSPPTEAYLHTWSIAVASFDNSASGGFGGRTDTTSPPYSSAYLNNTSLGTGENNYVTFTGITGLAVNPTGGDWITFTFATPLILSGNASYAFQVDSSTGWAGFDVSAGDAYAGGYDFTSWGAIGDNNNYVHDTSSADKAFVLNLTAVPVPEPSIAALAGLGILVLFGLKRRHAAS